MNTKKSKVRFRFIKKSLKLVVFLGILGFMGVGGVFAYYLKDLPSPASIGELKIAESTKIYDRTGEILLYDIHGEQQRTIITFQDIPEYVKHATIVAEDDNFYNHFGLDFQGIARAMLANIKGKTILQGGSTITQQLIKNIFLTPERTVSRKIKELILTLEMEVRYSKDEILNFYLNAIPYGSNSYGIEAASQIVFGKHAKDLTLSESALLASLPKAPTYYSPFGGNTDELKDRQEYILERMYGLGYITKKQLENARQEEMEYAYTVTGIKAPHFVMYVREQLEKDFGDSRLENDGLSVITTLDWDLQQEAERIVSEWAEVNKNKFNAQNAALVAIDPSTGQILSMVGSKDYFNQEIDGNVNVSTRKRQPGSSFKPFAYAKAFERGYTPDTILIDAETNFGVHGAKEYIPQNYSGEFIGPTTFKEALAQSMNVPAVKVLYLAGIQDTIELAQNMGINSLNRDTSYYGLSLVLGGGEVTLLEETSAYGVFAQEGIYNPSSAILSITSTSGDVLYSFSLNSREVLDTQISRLVTSILSDNDLRSPLFGPRSALLTPGIPSAVKTGTTQEYRDAWTIGYTPQVVVGVWVGNNDNSTMKNAAGVYAAAPIWNEFILKTYKLKEWKVEQFAPPKPIKTSKEILNGSLGDLITIPIDVISQKIATEHTPKELIEEKTFYEIHTILKYVDKYNPRGDVPKNPAVDPQFALWESGVNKWVNEQTTSTIVFGVPPTEYDDIHIPENFPKISILNPKDGSQILNREILIEMDVNNKFPIQQFEIIFDDRATTKITNLHIQNREYSKNVTLPIFFTEEVGLHNISIIAIDSVLNKSETYIQLINHKELTPRQTELF